MAASKHCVKYHNFTYVLGAEILRKRTVEFPQNVYTKKLGEVTVFYGVKILEPLMIFPSDKCRRITQIQENFSNDFFILHTEICPSKR